MLARLARVRVTIDRRTVARIFLNAPVLGALYLAILYACFVLDPLVPADQVLLGREAKQIADFVAIAFADVIEGIGLSLAAVAVVCGAMLGLAALLLLEVRARIATGAAPARAGLRPALRGLAVVVALHAAATLISMSRWPQIYVASFYAHGGVRAWVQVLATDRIGTARLVLASVVVLVAFLIGSPRNVVGLARRVHRFVRDGISEGGWLNRCYQRAKPWSMHALAVTSIFATCVACFALYKWTETDEERAERSAENDDPEEGQPARASKKMPRRSVLVLASDGLRADRMRPDLTPTLSALADRGARFDRAYVDVPRTMSSWATMLTGLHPHHHGLRSGFPRAEDLATPLDTLPRRLRAKGWRTIAVSDYAGDIFNRADFGFETVNAPPANFPAFLRQMAIERSTPLLPFLQSTLGRRAFPEMARWSGASDPRFVASAAIDQLENQRDEPFFMVVFFSTTHFPYAAPSPWHARYTQRDYRGPYRYDKTVTASVRTLPTQDDVVQIRGLYDGAVAAVDFAAGMILEQLARLGRADDTIVVVTSDHGETLFEHGRWHGHGDHFFGDESTHVPLVIVDPKTELRGYREDAIVSNVDFAPTLYELLDVAPPPRLDGRSLAPALRQGRLESRPAFAESELLLGTNPGLPPDLHFPARGLRSLLEVDVEHDSQIVLRQDAVAENLRERHRMVRDDRWKLLYMPTPNGVVYRLFDTWHDPDELTDVLEAHPEEAERLKALLWTWLLEDPRVAREGEFLVSSKRLNER